MGLVRGGWTGRGRLTLAGPQPPAAAGVLLGVAAGAESLGRATTSDRSLSDLVVFLLLGLAGTLPLTFLGPATAATGVCAAAVLSLAGFHLLTAGGFAASLFALYRLGRTGPRHGVALLPTPLATVTFLILAVLERPGREVQVLTVALASLAPLSTWAGSTQRAHLDAEEHGASREAIMGRLMEHTARAERTRIARELHDVVAHHISVIAVQAETARLTTPGMPAAGMQRLSEIGDAARAALTEMRLLLGVLRQDTEVETAERPPDRNPQPSLSQLNELLDDVRDANHAGTRLILRGRPVTLESGIELAAFRIIQEALTNARRHAPGAAVDVELVYTRESLLLAVRDNGPGPPVQPPGPDHGHGLLGMRERATAVGGQLRAGPAPSGGFLVEAALPARVEKTPSRVERTPPRAVETVDAESGSHR